MGYSPSQDRLVPQALLETALTFQNRLEIINDVSKGCELRTSSDGKRHLIALVTGLALQQVGVRFKSALLMFGCLSGYALGIIL